LNFFFFSSILYSNGKWIPDLKLDNSFIISFRINILNKVDAWKICKLWFLIKFFVWSVRNYWSSLFSICASKYNNRLLLLPNENTYCSNRFVLENICIILCRNRSTRLDRKTLVSIGRFNYLQKHFLSCLSSEKAQLILWLAFCNSKRSKHKWEKGYRINNISN